MKTFSRLIPRLVALVALLFGPAAFGQIAPPDPRPVVFSGGLTLQLTTSSYKVVQPLASDNIAGGNILPRATVAATALLGNRSNSAITFTFPDGASAAAKFEFALNDKDGNEVWRSDEGVGTEAITEETLKRGAVWRRVVRVPLIIEGTPLAVGNYTLVAFTDADKQVVAQTLLEIAAPPAVPGKGKINGTVLKVITPATAVEPEVTEPAAGALVRVRQLVLTPANGPQLFEWSGRADAEGKFSVAVPEGRYNVSAQESVVLQLGAVNVNGFQSEFLPQSVQVSVAAGQTVDVLLKLPKAPQPPAQGIKGLVVRSLPAEAAAPVGEVPVAGALVEVTEIVDRPDVVHIQVPENVGGFAFHRPFHWKGTTNAEGKFEVRTPAGKFRVTASKGVFGALDPLAGQINVAGGNALPGAVIILPPPGGNLWATAEVAVLSGAFSDVKLTLKPANVPTPQPLPVPVPAGRPDLR